MSRRRSSYLLESAPGFPVIPMIDVMLCLLIFFMLISRYLPPTLSVTLPEASASAVEDRPALMISIDVNGIMTLDGVETQWGDLTNALSNYSSEQQVRIAADRGADYDFIVRAMDACAQAGLNEIALETARPQ